MQVPASPVAVLSSPPLLHLLAARLDPLADLVAALHAALVDQPPQTVREGGMIRDGFDPKLDELRSLAGDSKSWIAALRQRMADATGIVTLKVGFTRVFGYYLEVPKAHAAKVPADWIRKQTVAGAERYVTPELKEKEEVVLHAEDRARELEFELFETLRQAVADHARRIQATARALAEIDALHGLAAIAAANRYCRPVFVAENIPRDDAGNPLHPLHPCMLLEIRDGRHPVLETLRLDPPFVPNDTDLSGEACQIALITGPNMAGKSTYIRQVALIALMAHMGGFVPASACRLGPLDRIFTRVGAMDQLARGQSTFLVEMSETANILNNATDRSLVILDEIGRGTSTYDGLSIAWAVV